MKLLGLLLFGLLGSGCVLAEPLETKFTVRVTDSETSLPVSNAMVRTTFTQKRDPWGTGKGQFNQVKLPVDQSGAVTLSGYQGKFEEGISARVFADGYYSDGNGFRFERKSLAFNRWEPWDPVIEVKMRPKKNPVPMIQKYIEWKPVPGIGSTVGYDLEVGDWVSPHGKGKISDLILTTSSYFQEGKRGSEARYVLSFSNEADGIQAYCFPEGLNSSFKWPYNAPMDGYQPIVEKFKHWDVNGAPDKSNYDEKNNYILRVRSRQLDDGSIIACYGMITGELEFIPQGKIKFSYYFNPVPNERSLEYNGENLLKK
jgi:hypothetical protein